jgi:hypothetical protein
MGAVTTAGVRVKASVWACGLGEDEPLRPAIPAPASPVAATAPITILVITMNASPLGAAGRCLGMPCPSSLIQPTLIGHRLRPASVAL